MTARRSPALLRQLVHTYQQQFISPTACRTLADCPQLCTRLLGAELQQGFSFQGGNWQYNQQYQYHGDSLSRLFSAQPQPAQEADSEDDRSKSGSHAQASVGQQPAAASQQHSRAPQQQAASQSRGVSQPESSSRDMSTLVGEDTARKCDEIIDSLTSTRSKAEGGHPSTRVQSLAHHMRHYLSLAWNGYLSVQGFVLAIPGAITHHIALPWAEKVEVYKGWWHATKREIKHYWVSCSYILLAVSTSQDLQFHVECIVATIACLPVELLQA